MKILITGANGQLGNELRVLLAEDPNHTCYFTDVQDLDICNEQAVYDFITKHPVEVIVNCAAFTAVDKAEDEPEWCERLNHLAPGYLAAAAQSCGAGFIQVSTDYVFNGTGHLPYTEDVQPCPNSVYGATKWAGEQMAMERCSRTVVIRTAWLYSSFGNNFVKTMIRLGHEREQLGVVFDQVGTPTYAADLAQAIVKILDRGIIPGIYHYSNEGVCSWYDFAVAIHRLAGITTCRVSPLHSSEYPAKAPRPAFSVLDKTRIKQVYGLQIPHWEESLQKCILLLR